VVSPPAEPGRMAVVSQPRKRSRLPKTPRSHDYASRSRLFGRAPTTKTAPCLYLVSSATVARLRDPIPAIVWDPNTHRWASTTLQLLDRDGYLTLHDTSRALASVELPSQVCEEPDEAFAEEFAFAEIQDLSAHQRGAGVHL